MANCETAKRYSNPKQVADAGELIYRQNLQSELEQTSIGKFVTIDIADGEYFVADTANESLRTANRVRPGGTFYLIRVCHTGAFEASYAAGPNKPERLS